MRKIIAAINMTLDGNADHTAVNPDAEIHDHYTALIKDADTLLYGRITYELMGFWKTLVEQPSGERSMDEFAVMMDSVQKIVFSNTLTKLEWESAKLAQRPLENVVKELKSESGGPVLVGSRSLIIQLMTLDLIDEFQLCIHPVITTGGLPLFEQVTHRKELRLKATKVFQSGAVVLYFERSKVS